MATLVKIRGLDRSAGATVGGAAGQDNLPRGFRVPSGLGLQYLGTLSSKAFGIIGTVGAPNAAIAYTVKNGGSFGNSVKVVQNAPSGSTTVITVTQAASTGVPTITITPSTTDTAATVVAAVNAHTWASQYVVASLVGTGASAPVASADANNVWTLAQGTGTTTGGTFTLTAPGYGTTAPIAWNATGATVATALQLVLRAAFGNATLVVTGSGTTLPASTTLTMSAAGGAATPFYNLVVDSSLLTPASTYTSTVTTYGTALAGTLAGGNNGTGTGQPVHLVVNNKSNVIVDVDDPLTLRALQRNKQRFISLGQP